MHNTHNIGSVNVAPGTVIYNVSTCVASLHETSRRICMTGETTTYAPSDYHLFRSISHGLLEQRFQSYEDVEKWVKERIESENEAFYRCGGRLLPKR
ncbi:hypothetical protein ANCDUO_03213 [Ancylostoma duodenale]|uniref:Uncharacterized protein n=1 Tax=Ancylostoma duodenale TaxID=51022 RepID=A0A0C2D9M7_9BILA|nr:hypothetical protein ANCDUO_03213 [Ancylostoma duodenale]